MTTKKNNLVPKKVKISFPCVLTGRYQGWMDAHWIKDQSELDEFCLEQGDDKTTFEVWTSTGNKVRCKVSANVVPAPMPRKRSKRK